jgi:AcrR family transcriptional regulator
MAAALPDPQASISPGSKRERTRARLIEAAAQVIAERGFHRTTLDEVARRAGMTKGAIYGNFQSKEDLILAVNAAKARRPAISFEPGQSLRTQLRRMGEAVVAMAPHAQQHAVLTVEFELYALTHDEMRQRLYEAYLERRKRAAADIAAATDPKDLPLKPEQFAIVLYALMGGLLHQRFVTPEQVTDELIISAFEALA